MERYAWLQLLADKLINNPFLAVDESEEESDDAGEGPSTRYGECGNQVYMEHHAKCRACGASTHWACACGYVCCRAGKSDKAPKGKQAVKCDAYFRHLMDKFAM